MTAVANPKIDSRKYGKLLARTLPQAIRTEKENERMLAEVDSLMSKPEDKLTPEEHALLELLFTLIERFEEEHYPIPEAPPHSIIQTLMQERELRQRDLVPVLGSRGVTSEVVTGKRKPSKAQAKALAKFFSVSPELFI
ncbi:MAG TPA: transcriptional regulator [Blastocatellia bacterium]|nr:transcriptional regulator [Blastocatellia bacterium]